MKINAKRLVGQCAYFLKSNSHTICSIGTLAGIALSAYFLIDETTKANQILSEMDDDIDFKEKVVTTVGCYKKSICSLTVTSALVIFNDCNYRSMKASYAGMVAVAQNSYKNYRQAVQEEVGKEKELEIMKKSLEKYIPHGLSDGKRLYYDVDSDQYFESTPEDVAKGCTYLYQALVMDGRATVNDVYSVMGAEPIEGGDFSGWSTSACYCEGFNRFPELELTDYKGVDGKPPFTEICFSVTPSVDDYFWEEINYMSDEELVKLLQDGTLFSAAYNEGYLDLPHLKWNK